MKELEQVQELELEEDDSPPQEDDGDNVGIEIGLWARIHPHLGYYNNFTRMMSGKIILRLVTLDSSFNHIVIIVSIKLSFNWITGTRD